MMNVAAARGTFTEDQISSWAHLLHTPEVCFGSSGSRRSRAQMDVCILDGEDLSGAR